MPKRSVLPRPVLTAHRPLSFPLSFAHDNHIRAIAMGGTFSRVVQIWSSREQVASITARRLYSCALSVCRVCLALEISSCARSLIFY